jgi:uncharacterized repeat protein (TIGR03803 family)
MAWTPRRRRTLTSIGILASALLLLAATLAKTGVIYSFAGDEDGEYPDTDLVMDAAGNLFGTTVSGGDFGGGTAFELTRTGSNWTHTVLYDFRAQRDGGEPYGGVTLDAQGNLYGTAVVGGTGGTCVEEGCGVVYELTNSGGTWSEKVIHNFTGGNDGYGPGQGLTIGPDGSLYGMTPTGGADGLGVIYQLQPQGASWNFQVIHTFTGGDDGATGSKGRLLLRSGAIYGVATAGGANGSGTAFQLRPSPGGGEWQFRTLYAFAGQPDAGFPYGALVADDAGNLYGTTYYDGANNLGSVYRLHRVAGGTWTEQLLYSFQGNSDGSGPISNLVFDRAGNLYGTTSEGGALGCGCGTIFELAAGTFSERIVYRFTGAPDGDSPYSGMVGDGAGNFFGTTVRGGASDEGAVFRFRP